MSNTKHVDWSEIVKSLTILRYEGSIVSVLHLIVGLISYYWWYIYENDPVLRLRWPSRSRINLVAIFVWPIPRQIGWYMPDTLSCAIPFAFTILTLWFAFDTILSLLFHLYATFNLAQNQLDEVLGRTQASSTPNTPMASPISSLQEKSLHVNEQPKQQFLGGQLTATAAAAIEAPKSIHFNFSQVVPIHQSTSHELSVNEAQYIEWNPVGVCWRINLRIRKLLQRLDTWRKLIFAYVVLSVILYIAFIIGSIYEYDDYAYYCPSWTVSNTFYTFRATLSCCLIAALASQIRLHVDRLGIKRAWIRCAKTCIGIIIPYAILSTITTIYHPMTNVTKLLFTIQEMIPITGAFLVTIVLYTIPAYQAHQRYIARFRDKDRGVRSFSQAILLLKGATLEDIEKSPRDFANPTTLRLFLETKDGLTAFAVLTAETFTTESLIYYIEVMKYKKLWNRMQRSKKQGGGEGGLASRVTREAVEEQARSIYNQFLWAGSPMEININGHELMRFRTVGSYFQPFPEQPAKGASKLDIGSKLDRSSSNSTIGKTQGGAAETLFRAVVGHRGDAEIDGYRNERRQSRVAERLADIEPQHRPAPVMLAQRQRKDSLRPSVQPHIVTELTEDVFDASLRDILAMLCENLIGDFLSLKKNKETWIAFLHGQMERERLELVYDSRIQLGRT